MALRLHRRTLTLTSSLIRNYHHSISPISPSPCLVQSHNPSSSSFSFIPQNPRNVSATSSHLLFRSSYSTRSYTNKDDDEKLGPDTILFEGCDYKHWLITMEFPKDHRPTPEEMVETYVQTAAKVVGSVEEAKRRIYACSTTTYQGFQIEVDEDTSEKFKGLPGVVFILPDSYIDPVNKEYGGDKYVNGTIIPRPPPIQYGRNNRYNDRNRNDRPRNDRPPYQGNQPYDRQGSPQGDGRNYGGAQQGYTPQHDYTQQQTYRPQQNYSQAPQQQNYSQAPQQNYSQAPQQQNYSQAPQQNYSQGPQQQNHSQAPQQNYSQGPQQQNHSQAPQQQNYPPQNYHPQGPPQGYPPQGPPQGYPTQGSPQPPQQNYSPTGGRDQRYQDPENIGRGDNRNFGPSSGGDYRQGAGSSYGQSHPAEQKTGIQEDKRFYS